MDFERTVPSWWITVLATAGLFAGLACGGGAGQPNPPPGDAPASPDPNERRTSVDVSEGTYDSLEADGASDLILEFVADGVLDFAEYEQGVLAYVACMEGYGWTSSPGHPRLAPWGQYQVRFELYTAEDREARGASLSDLSSWDAECTRLFWRELGRIWNASHSPSEVEQQAARNAVASCMNDAGRDIREQPDARLLEDLFYGDAEEGADMGAWVDCIRRVEAEHFTSGTGIQFVAP